MEKLAELNMMKVKN